MKRRPAMLYERKSASRAPLLILLIILLAFLLFQVWFVNRFFVVTVSGSSMLNTISGERYGEDGSRIAGDIVYADRSAAAERGDIVIIDVTDYRAEFGLSGSFIIKRLIATEGDRVRIEGGQVYLCTAGSTEFSLLDEPYALGETYAESESTEWTVGEGEIFFLGDNRTASRDSRDLGCFLQEDIIGVVPEWSVRYKGAITAWERFRASLFGWLR